MTVFMCECNKQTEIVRNLLIEREIENITGSRVDTKFFFQFGKKYLTSAHSEQVKYFSTIDVNMFHYSIKTRLKHQTISGFIT